MFLGKYFLTIKKEFKIRSVVEGRKKLCTRGENNLPYIKIILPAGYPKDPAR